MAQVDVKANFGTLDFKVEGIEKPCKTWYIVFGGLDNAKRPLVVLHGGPGLPHDYLLPIARLAGTEHIPVIMHDQLGYGLSTLLPEKMGDSAFW